MTGHTDVAGVVAHYRQLIARDAELTAAGTGPQVVHVVAHLRDVAAGSDAARASQLRAVGEGLLVACYVHQRDMQDRYPGVAMVQPLLTLEVLAGLQLVDEAFVLATAGEGS